MNNCQISKRAESLLKHLVSVYLREGMPVGSKTLTQAGITTLSPASVRKILSDLEEQGYLVSPHTSSGRIPTSMGLRYFVDSLQSFHALDSVDLATFQQKLHPNQPTDDLLTTTSNVLSELTHMVGIVSLPKLEQLILKHVEFLPLPDNKILVILVLNEAVVQNRIIVVDRSYTPSELTQISNFLMCHFAGRDLQEVRRELVHQLQSDRIEMDSLMQAVVDIAAKTFKADKPSPDYKLAGQQNLLTHASQITMDHLQKIFNAFTEKQQILEILDKCLHSDGVQLYIGEESGYDALNEYSIVTSRYSVDGKLVGVLGVIGPTRMPYSKIIPIVDLTAKMLSTALEQDI